MRMDWNRWATATPIAEWFGRALKRVKNLCCNKVCLAALCRKARSQESSVLASSHGLNMLPARAESCAEYARFGNIQFEYTVAADRSYWLCLGDRAEAWSTLPTSRTSLRVYAHIHARMRPAIAQLIHAFMQLCVPWSCQTMWCANARSLSRASLACRLVVNFAGRSNDVLCAYITNVRPTHIDARVHV